MCANRLKCVWWWGACICASNRLCRSSTHQTPLPPQRASPGARAPVGAGVQCSCICMHAWCPHACMHLRCACVMRRCSRSRKGGVGQHGFHCNTANKRSACMARQRVHTRVGAGVRARARTRMHARTHGRAHTQTGRGRLRVLWEGLAGWVRGRGGAAAWQERAGAEWGGGKRANGEEREQEEEVRDERCVM